uniref:Uncharacterized protein LOC116950851 isoform X1 n=2 Tax=Petromyzon marinus TaxID=7757 RepID=A0AAJ7TV98_PETMA|nr:uncharacterized protein LOC116950851 isoform X1 [Petromyzon marinus]
MYERGGRRSYRVCPCEDDIAAQDGVTLTKMHREGQMQDSGSDSDPLTGAVEGRPLTPTHLSVPVLMGEPGPPRMCPPEGTPMASRRHSWELPQPAAGNTAHVAAARRPSSLPCQSRDEVFQEMGSTEEASSCTHHADGFDGDGSTGTSEPLGETEDGQSKRSSLQQLQELIRRHDAGIQGRSETRPNHSGLSIYDFLREIDRESGPGLPETRPGSEESGPRRGDAAPGLEKPARSFGLFRNRRVTGVSKARGDPVPDLRAAGLGLKSRPRPQTPPPRTQRSIRPIVHNTGDALGLAVNGVLFGETATQPLGDDGLPGGVSALRERPLGGPMAMALSLCAVPLRQSRPVASALPSPRRTSPSVARELPTSVDARVSPSPLARSASFCDLVSPTSEQASEGSGPTTMRPRALSTDSTLSLSRPHHGSSAQSQHGSSVPCSPTGSAAAPPDGSWPNAGSEVAWEHEEAEHEEEEEEVEEDDDWDAEAERVLHEGASVLAAGSWGATVDPDFARRQPRAVSQRQEVIYELMQTEAHVLRTLRVALRVYARGLRRHAGLAPEAVRRLVPCAPALARVHAAFLRAMLARRRQALGSGGSGDFLVTRLGDVLLQQFSGACGERLVSTYAEFCSRHREALALHKELLARDRKFQAFIQKQSRSPEVYRMGIPECILLVTQRITKYPVLIERILQHTEAHTKEHEDVTRALRRVREAVSAVDARVCERSLDARLAHIVARLCDGARVSVSSAAAAAAAPPLPLSSSQQQQQQQQQQQASPAGSAGSSRPPAGDDATASGAGELGPRSWGRLLHEGVVALKSGGGRMKDTLLLLLSDSLVFLQERDNKYAFASLDRKPAEVPLRGLFVREIANDERGLFLLYDSEQGPHMYEVHLASRDARDSWRERIRQAAAERYQEPRMHRASVKETSAPSRQAAPERAEQVGGQDDWAEVCAEPQVPTRIRAMIDEAIRHAESLEGLVSAYQATGLCSGGAVARQDSTVSCCAAPGRSCKGAAAAAGAGAVVVVGRGHDGAGRDGSETHAGPHRANSLAALESGGLLTTAGLEAKGILTRSDSSLLSHFSKEWRHLPDMQKCASCPASTGRPITITSFGKTQGEVVGKAQELTRLLCSIKSALFLPNSSPLEGPDSTSSSRSSVTESSSTVGTNRSESSSALGTSVVSNSSSAAGTAMTPDAEQPLIHTSALAEAEWGRTRAAGGHPSTTSDPAEGPGTTWWKSRGLGRRGSLGTTSSSSLSSSSSSTSSLSSRSSSAVAGMGLGAGPAPVRAAATSGQQQQEEASDEKSQQRRLVGAGILNRWRGQSLPGRDADCHPTGRAGGKAGGAGPGTEGGDTLSRRHPHPSTALLRSFMREEEERRGRARPTEEKEARSRGHFVA